MGLGELVASLRPGVRPAELAAAYALEPPVVAAHQLGIASPWSQPNHLASVVWSDIFGTDVAPVNRAEAMSVPAVARARHILCTVIANIPLRAYRGTRELGAPGNDAAPTWVAGTNQALSPYHRMLWTVDDLLFFGASCWSRVNDAAGRFPVRMDRLPMGRWTINGDGQICVDNLDGRGHQPVPANQVCLIPGPHEGLLHFAQDAIRHAKDLHRAADRAAKFPAAYLALKQTGGDPLTDAQVNDLVAGWAAARRGENGGVAFLNQSVDAKELGTFDHHLVLEGRNAAAVDIARAASLPADLLDAAGEHSLTYANVRDNDKRAIEYGAGMYLSAISAALTQDGVTPHGQSVRFDIESWLGAVPTATASNPGPGNRPTPTAEEPAA